MEEFKNDIYDRVMVNYDHEFIENDKIDVTASYVVLCEEDIDNEFNRPIYKNNILGLQICDFVKMACDGEPACLVTYKEEKLLEIIKPYISSACDYTVVLYGDTPLVSKSHLNDLLGYVSRKRLNVCKLKRGYILKNDYILEADEIYSSLVYDLASNDFLTVKTISDLDKVKEILENQMFNFHKKNGVIFENQKTVTIDANVKIGSGTVIGSNVSLLNNTVIAENCLIESGSVIDNSKIESNVQIGKGNIIDNSLVKESSIIKDKSLINKSVIKQNVVIGSGVNIIKSAINEGASVNDFSSLENVNALSSAKIGYSSTIIGDGVVVAVEENSEVLSGSRIIKRADKV